MDKVCADVTALFLEELTTLFVTFIGAVYCFSGPAIDEGLEEIMFAILLSDIILLIYF